MEILWRWLNIFLGLIFLQLCNGIPISLEGSVTDKHTQLLTGLVAVLLAACSIIFLAGCLCCQRRQGFKEFRDTPVASSSLNLDQGHINPIANGEFTIFSPLSPPHHNNNIFLANEQIITRTPQDYIYGDINVSSWFCGPEKDFPRIKLKYIKELGNGWFGKVVEGAAKDLQNINDNEAPWTPVVVRILEATAGHKERVLFLNDAAIYKCGPHSNLLSLLGRCLDTIPLLLLQEYCPQGDLKYYLKTQMKKAESLLFNDCTLTWCHQLASALTHLHDNGVNHPDLATRNCQLTSNLTLKLGDYGLAVTIYPEDYYQGSPAIPVRWRSPESLACTTTTIQAKKVTSEDNIWSLGVTFWEVFECGEQPYSDLSDDEVISQVLGPPNVRLPIPKCHNHYVNYVYYIMQLCWNNIESRPTVSQILLMLSDLLEHHKNAKATNSLSTDDFEQKWESFKPNSIVKIDSIVEGNANSEINITNSALPTLHNLQPSNAGVPVSGTNDINDPLTYSTRFLNDQIKSVPGQGLNSFDLENPLSNSNYLSNTTIRNFEPTGVDFDLSPKYSNTDYCPSDNMLVFQRSSSGSETEDENWRTKVERGAYTEKVRLKSKSAADLMVLTHVDYSESESETPLPSLDYRVNYKNVRLVPKNNLENLSFTYGSEGNLLNIQDKFQDELRKLREEHRDSPLFVPDSHSQSSFNEVDNNRNTVSMEDLKSCDTKLNTMPVADSTSKRLMLELNTVAEIKPPQQIFSVFNVTIDKFQPLNLNHKLNELISFNEKNNNFKVEKAQELDVSENVKDVTDSSTKEPSADCVAHQFEFENCLNKENHIENISHTNKEAYQNTNSGDISSPGVIQDVNRFSLQETKIDIEDIPSVVNKREYQVHENQIQAQELQDQPYSLKQSYHELTEESNRCKNMEQDESPSLFNNTEEMILELKNEPHMDELANTRVVCDITTSQEDSKNLALTHTSTPFRKKENISVSSEDRPTGFNLFGNIEKLGNEVSKESTFSGVKADKELNYSLETWDSFLGKTFDDQNKALKENLFDSFSSDHHSMLFVENEDNDQRLECDKQTISFDVKPNDSLPDLRNATFLVLNDNTFTVDNNTAQDESNESNPETNSLDVTSDGVPENCSWENEKGWFLHPQVSQSSEPIKTSSNNMPSYVGFGIDDEIMTAIRNELLTKLPHAQGIASEKVVDADEWETTEKDEVFLKYNVYNPPLSPILEESYNEEISGILIQKPGSETDSEWSEFSGLEEHSVHNVENQSSVTCESLYKEQNHRHTLSQDSCCSNDTLFNLEELSTAVTEHDKEHEILLKIVESEDKSTNPTVDPNVENVLNDSEGLTEALKGSDVEANIFGESDIDILTNETESRSENNTKTLQPSNINTNEINISEQTICEPKSNDDTEWTRSEFRIMDPSENEIQDCINKFISGEKDHTSKSMVVIYTPNITANLHEETSSQQPLPFMEMQIAPLPSPEDSPWKQLPASMLNYDIVISKNDTLTLPITDSHTPLFNDTSEKSDPVSKSEYQHEIDNKNSCDSDLESVNSVNYNTNEDNKIEDICDDIKKSSDSYNEVDYVNIINLENTNRTECINLNEKPKTKYITNKINNEMVDDDIFGMLTDIRFHGPANNQLLPSFSENNDLNDEQEWDSGSDSRSSSNGEFIWKEGEHEESLKALQAVPQLIQDSEDVQFVEDSSDDGSTSTKSDEEGEIPEFVPSAWDKFATPTKSALRSPEKLSQKSDTQKTKGVWFKKQKYHCIYEYPREPESPILQSQHLWQPHVDYNSFTDWEFDVDSYMPTATEIDEPISNTCCLSKRTSNSNLYQLTNITDINPNSKKRDELLVNNPVKPFDVVSLSSQFFPGSINWKNDTPESGLEDLTPASLSDNDSKSNNVETLEKLALEVVNKNKHASAKDNEVMGGLRHTRDKLKLDLPPSPSAFTSSDIFTMEPVLESVVREKPTFTTFGKGRFLIQQINTPPLYQKDNIFFESLPYQPLNQTDLKSNPPDESLILKDGFNKGCKENRLDTEEHSLDSADEDSGIESSTLERNLDNIL